MIIQASNGCYLTENFEVDINERRFVKSMNVANIEEATLWKEITKLEMKQMLDEGAIFEPEEITYSYLNKVDSLIVNITENINDANLTNAEALEKKNYFPKWEDLLNTEAVIGFRLQYNDTLYEVIQPHTFSEEWIPNVGTESLYKVVQIEASGTIDDPIVWAYNMELFAGKYYKDKGILYICIRDSGMGMAYENLSDLVSGGFVEVVDEESSEETDTEADGTIENPIPYVKGVTNIEKDKYYIENGIIYKAIQDAGVLIYDLSQVPAIAQKVD